MPARRLGRIIGSLLMLAVLAIGGYAAGAGAFEQSGRGLVADPVAPPIADPVAPPITEPGAPALTDPPPAAEGDYHTDGWEWS